MKDAKRSVSKVSWANLPTIYGVFQIVVFKSLKDNLEHIALIRGKKLKQPVLTRIHSQCLTGDVFSSLKCDCGKQLDKSMKLIGKKGGVMLYLNQEGRGVGLANKISAYSLQDQGIDTVEANLHLGLPADARDYEAAAEMLQVLNIFQINLLTNNPQKEKGLKKYGIMVKNVVPIEAAPNRLNRTYLLAKKQKLGHKLTRV